MSIMNTRLNEEYLTGVHRKTQNICGTFGLKRRYLDVTLLSIPVTCHKKLAFGSNTTYFSRILY